MMASQTKPPLKSILKQTKALPPPPTSSALANASARDPRAIALHHATLLQTRKDTEAAIFESTLALLDLPFHASHPPSAPHPADVAAFTHHVRLFQPSDYDDLITERNLDTNAGALPAGKCGYALCPRPRRRFRGAGRYKMVNKGRRDFDIVETAEVEKWCSAECTRRALWVKVQLSETAAWERAGGAELRVELYPEKQEEEGESKKAGAAVTTTERGEGEKLAAEMGKLQLDEEGLESEELATEMARLRLEQDRKAASDRAALAVERGDDAGDVSTRAVGIMVREKKVTMRAEAPSLGNQENTIEGYKSSFGRERHSDDEDMDDDWV